MSEMVKKAAKKPETIKENKVSQMEERCSTQSITSPINRILFLQRTMGNQAVSKLIKSGALQAIQRACPKCKDECKLQAKATSGNISAVKPDIESQIQSLKGGGNPLSENDRTFFEPLFGSDLSQVRMHTDGRAAELARAVNARAFTMGSDVVFGAGQYSPDTMMGKRLLAHELTHVMQQGNKVSFKPMGKASVIQRSIIDVTLPDGKIIKVNCEAPPPPAPGLTPAPCKMKDLIPPTGKQKTACESTLKSAMADSNVNKIIGNLKSLKGCSVPTMDCKKCTAGCEGAGAWHFPNAIHICADKNPNNTQMISYLKHELTHELQYCRPSPDVNCEDRMKMEIEAYKAAGRNFESSFQGAVWSSCYTMRCKDSDINKGMAAAMKKYYDSL